MQTLVGAYVICNVFTLNSSGQMELSQGSENPLRNFLCVLMEENTRFSPSHWIQEAKKVPAQKLALFDFYFLMALSDFGFRLGLQMPITLIIF